MTRRVFFGSEAQQALLQKGASAFHLFHDHPDFTYYGRTVGITSLKQASLETLIALARLQGSGSCSNLTQKEADSATPKLKAAGLSPHRFALWTSTEDCLQNARNILAKRPLPKDLTLEWLSPDTSDATRQSLGDLALSVGVLPPNLSVLTGEIKPGACAMVLDAQGAVVSCAAAASYPNAEPAVGQTAAWWGMLSTHESQRGRGLSMHLGAAVMIEMANRYGYTAFFTGVTSGNGPSEAVCTRMSLINSGLWVLSASDESQLPGGRLTK